MLAKSAVEFRSRSLEPKLTAKKLFGKQPTKVPEFHQCQERIALDIRKYENSCNTFILTYEKGNKIDTYDWRGYIDKCVWQYWRQPQKYYVE